MDGSNFSKNSIKVYFSIYDSFIINYMENIEQRFYDFVRQQLEKRKDKLITRSDDEDIMSKNYINMRK